MITSSRTYAESQLLIIETMYQQLYGHNRIASYFNWNILFLEYIFFVYKGLRVLCKLELNVELKEFKRVYEDTIYEDTKIRQTRSLLDHHIALIYISAVTFGSRGWLDILVQEAKEKTKRKAEETQQTSRA